MLLQIGEMLGLSLEGVRMLPASEITLWVAYLKIKNTPEGEKPKSDIQGFQNLMKKG